jgi:hypothetical protein
MAVASSVVPTARNAVVAGTEGGAPEGASGVETFPRKWHPRIMVTINPNNTI